MKFYNIQLLFLLVLLLCFSACEKDSVVTETVTTTALGEVSGNASLDTDGDGLGDAPLANTRVILGNLADITTLLPDVPEDQIGPDVEIFSTQTDENGDYAFQGLAPLTDKVIMLLPNPALGNIQGVDQTEDGDPSEAIASEVIQVEVGEDEVDDGNNFVVQVLTTAIQGFVLEDTVGDSVGDLGLPMITIQLYLRDESGRPDFEAFIAETETNDFGAFSLEGITPGEYCLYLPDEYDFSFIGAEDETPDPDGVNGTGGPNYLPVDLTENEIDADNIFTVTRFSYSIHGVVLEDTDGDGVGDTGAGGHWVRLYARDDNGQPIGPQLGVQYTGDDGLFSFPLLGYGNYVIYLEGTENYYYNCFKGEDTSPEPGEPTEHPSCDLIQVDVSPAFPMDEGNTFTINREDDNSQVNGNVLEDINADGIGDLPAPGHRLELYRRTDSGVPMTPLIDAAYSDENGYFRFEVTEPGEYVIYHIGTGDYPYTCISGSDLSPEPGEPTEHPECIFIQVDLADVNEPDQDNTYVIKKN